MTADTPSPCERGCLYFEDCRDEHLSCAAFAWYLEHGTARGKREPTREHYIKQFETPERRYVYQSKTDR
jgi:hypothetical protein